MVKRFGEILIGNGAVSPHDLEQALERQQQSPGRRIGETLVAMGLIDHAQVAQALSLQFGLPIAAANHFPQFPVLEGRVSPRFLKDAGVLPLSEDADRVVIAMVSPQDQEIIDAFHVLTGRPIEVRIAAEDELTDAFERLYGDGQTVMDRIVEDMEAGDLESPSQDIQHLKDQASEAPVIRLVSLIIRRAIESRASDVHVEPFEKRLVVRYRIDGVMHEVESPPRNLAAAIISRVKIMANLDIAERRLPQDGRVKLKVEDREIDLRVSTVPTIHGESVVMRILDKGGVPLDFASLGFEPHVKAKFTDLLERPHGILLVTGPTGSGKTTTLYAALAMLNRPEVKILTIEDPVEYQMEGINQIQVKPQIELTFANALRSIVRQDPDVIMVGEIRDRETAEIAVQSALTGHLVLSTLHTNDAASTVNRLLDMGVEDYLLATTIIGIQAQRLVRVLCRHCRRPYRALPEMIEETGPAQFADSREQVTLYDASGCEHCAHTGFAGRSAIIEVLPMSDGIRGLVMRHATAADLARQAMSEGMETMYQHGLRKVVAGITTLEEVLRVTREEA